MQIQILRLRKASFDWSQRYGVLATAIALGVLTLGLFYWRIIRGYTPPVGWVKWPIPPDWVQQLNILRWGVRAVLVGAGLGLFWLEWAGGTMSGLVRQALSTRWKTVLFIGLLTALIGTFLFEPGNYVIPDNRPNISAPWAALKSIKAGEPFVYWTTYVHLGGPFMQFHNSLYYYFAAVVGFLIGNFFDTAEVSAYLLFIVSGFTMYLFARQLTGSRLAGLVAALAYCGSFDRYQILSLGANNPLGALWFVFLPLPFLFIERICSGPAAWQRRDLFWLALSIGANLWTHPLHGAWTLGFAALYALVRVSFLKSLSWQQRLARVGGLMAALAGGALIGLYELLPIPLEGHLLPASSRTNGLGLERILNRDIATQFGGHYIGLAILVFAILGIALIFILKQTQAYALVGLAILPLGLAIGPHYLPFINDILAALPLGNVVYAKGSERYVYVALLPLAALIGLFVHLLPAFWAKLGEKRWTTQIAHWPPERMSVLVVTAILLESVPMTMWYGNKSPDSYLVDTPGRWPIIATLAQTTDKTARVYDAGEDLIPSFFYPMLTGHPSLGGNYEDAPPSVVTIDDLHQRIKLEAASGALSPESINLLYELNIGYLVTNGVDLTLPELELMQRTDSATLWRVPYHSPIAATAHPSAEGDVTVTAPTGSDVPVTLNRQVETATTVTLDFTLPQRAFVQLSYSAYPYQRVLLDGQPITVTQTPGGLIGFWAEAGSHTVEVLPELSPLRKWTLAIGAVSFLIALVFALYPNRRVE